MAAASFDNRFEEDPEIDNSESFSKRSSKSAGSTTITYEDVASKLLKDNLLLTALELHTELAESGRQNHKLRDYFSNPSNFERNTQIRTDLASNLGAWSSIIV